MPGISQGAKLLCSGFYLGFACATISRLDHLSIIVNVPNLLGVFLWMLIISLIPTVKWGEVDRF